MAVLPLLAACGEKVPEATDEQLLQLVGSSLTFLGSDAPLNISKRTVECVQLLSGLADEIVKDMPEEILGQIKTDCRKNLDIVVKDPAKNPIGFKLAHFENKELAERIATLKETTDEANRKAAREKAARAEQEARAKAEGELKDLRSSYGEFVASIDDRVRETKAACDEWVAVRTEVNAKIKWNNWRNRFPSPLCSDQVSDIQKKASQHLAALNATEVSGSGTFFSFQKPYFGNASAEWFDDQLVRLKDEIRQMKAVLAD